MVPAPSQWYQRFGGKLYVRIEPVAEKLGLVATYETSVYRPGVGDRDYRTPDLVVFDARHGSKRGVEGVAELAIEILSPGDETHDKLPFYVEVGVREILIIDPTRAPSSSTSRGAESRRRSLLPATAPCAWPPWV